VSTPEPGPRQIRIRVRAAALNFFDLLQIQGKYQIKPPFPFIPGAEVAGTVEALGSQTEGFAPGDAVMAIVNQGGYSEAAVAEASRAFRIPEGMSFPEAAAMPIVYHTSYFALHKRAILLAREWLLVHAGASGVGMSAIQIGKAAGARIIATAGSPEKLAFCLEQGADHAIDYRDPAWVDRVKEITAAHGADVIYDPVGGDVFELSTRCIASEGRLLVIGFASGRIPAVQANRVLLKNISVVGAIWGPYVQRHPEYVAETQIALERMYVAGRIRPAVSALYPLEEAPHALRDLASRKILGKAALVI
jgi:NADPH2:quinone reductase